MKWNLETKRVVNAVKSSDTQSMFFPCLGVLNVSRLIAHIVARPFVKVEQVGGGVPL